MGTAIAPIIAGAVVVMVLLRILRRHPYLRQPMRAANRDQLRRLRRLDQRPANRGRNRAQAHGTQRQPEQDFAQR